MKISKPSLIDVMGWIVGILGVVASILSAFANEENGFFAIFVGLLVAEAIVAVAWFWSLHEKYKLGRDQEQLQLTNNKLEEENSKLHDELEKQKKESEEKINKIREKLGTICASLKSASKLYNEIYTQIPNISEHSYHVLETLQNSSIKDDPILQKEATYALNEFAEGLFGIYKRYTLNMLTALVSIEETYLEIKETPIKVAATVKLFNKPYNKNDEKKGTIIYTAFRDKKTYEKGEREVGGVEYTIDGNIDFVKCLNSDHFVINNATRNSENYMNEHVDFDSYYNCAAVVAIRTKNPDGSFRYFGYLCCDCKNTKENTEVFDKKSAQLLFSLAQQYAIFLNALDSNWMDRVEPNLKGIPEDFLQLVYSKTFSEKTKKH